MEFADVMEKRRAVNFFDPNRPVDPNLLRKMVETAARAPSGFNFQPWSLVVLTEPGDKARLRPIAWDQPKITEAPVILMVLADRTVWQPENPWFQRNYKEMVAAGTPKDKYDWLVNGCNSLYGETREKSQAFACKNAGFFAMALMLAAKDLGLDTHPMDGFDHEAVRAEFSIPDRFWIICLMAVGYFDTSRTLAPPKWRKTYDEIVVSF